VLRRHLRLRRVLSVAALTAAILPLLASIASAQDASVGRIGNAYDPDPLTGLEAWAIYGGTIVGGFLIATILTVLSSRGSSTRYRPGQPWDHDEVWIGKTPDAAEGDAPHAALPGSGGTSGSW
jgi:hypothetical protein